MCEKVCHLYSMYDQLLTYLRYSLLFIPSSRLIFFSRTFPDFVKFKEIFQDLENEFVIFQDLENEFVIFQVNIYTVSPILGRTMIWNQPFSTSTENSV